MNCFGQNFVDAHLSILTVGTDFLTFNTRTDAESLPNREVTITRLTIPKHELPGPNAL
jgi:hypothetical protein